MDEPVQAYHLRHARGGSAPVGRGITPGALFVCARSRVAGVSRHLSHVPARILARRARWSENAHRIWAGRAHECQPRPPSGRVGNIPSLDPQLRRLRPGSGARDVQDVCSQTVRGFSRDVHVRARIQPRPELTGTSDCRKCSPPRRGGMSRWWVLLQSTIRSRFAQLVPRQKTVPVVRGIRGAPHTRVDCASGARYASIVPAS